MTALFVRHYKMTRFSVSFMMAPLRRFFDRFQFRVHTGRPAVVVSWVAMVAIILPPKVVGAPSTQGDSLLGSRPNIIFVLTDDQGYGDFSCHGNPILRTPNLDRLHDEGVRFTRFQVSPTCAPSRSALMTGRHEFRNGVTHTIYERERLTLNAVTVAQVLKDAGYTTGIFGKWHLGDEPAYQPDRRGFDEVFVHGGGGIGQTFPGSCGDAPGNTYFDPAILHNGKFEKTSGYCTDVFFRQALHWIGSVKQRKPFFAYIACNAPHAPLQVPSEYERLYAGRVNTNTAKFYGMIANIDDNIGRLLAQLKDWDLDRQTLIVFMNDNGGTVGGPTYNAGMRGLKCTPWLGGIRAASFWRWPGKLQPAEVDGLAAHIDLFPTLAEFAGARLSPAVQTQVEGRSLLPLLQNPDAPWENRLLFTHVGRWERGRAASAKYRQCSVRDDRWQLVCASDSGAKAWQLFDLKADSGEKADVSAQFPDVVRRLELGYDQWWDSVQPQLVNETAVGPPQNPFKEKYWKQHAGKSGPPNLVFILADDLGYGDVRCYNSRSKIPTPNLDRLASEGMRFTDAHAPDSSCTPSRYGILTGRYCFRSRLISGVLPPWGEPLIEPGRLTVPALLRQYGYSTAALGKWHLGWGWTTTDGQRPASGDGLSNVDFTRKLQGGPLTRGFDEYFGVDLPNFPPYCFIDQDRTVGIPSVAAPMRKGGFNRPGPMVPDWNQTNILPEITRRAVTYLEHAAQTNRNFFLYFALTAPHYPVVPTAEFKGRSQAGDYGDFVAQVDGTVGAVLEVLARTGLATNTLIIFTSDNGPECVEIDPGAYDRIQRYGHWSMDGLRGVKRDTWEGGHRVPFIARWPGRIPAHKVNPETICEVDLLATCASLLGAKLPADAGEDSYDILPVLLGRKHRRPIREATVLHGGDGRFAIRQGDWILIDSSSGDGNGGRGGRGGEPEWFKQTRGYTAHQLNGELYDLKHDLAERRNLFAERPDVVQKLKTLLEKYKVEGHSQPAAEQD